MVPMSSLVLRRVYDTPVEGDGRRVLVDRLWPRGLTREDPRIDEWLPGVAPSTELRRWFAHEPSRWQEFSARYRRELTGNEALEHLLALARAGPVVLVFAARDEAHSNARVLGELLHERLG
jgi:uncharacterized protein YeaO (DUF488 family)